MTARLPDETELHYERCVDLWVTWMDTKPKVRGFSRRDSVCGQALTNFMASEDDADTDLIYQNSDIRLAETVNACVDSLMPDERLAFYILHGFARVWPFKHDQRRSLDLAVVTLRRLIAKRT